MTKSSGEPTDESDEETILKQWEKEILEVEGAEERVQKLEDELRLAAMSTALRGRAGVPYRGLAVKLYYLYGDMPLNQIRDINLSQD